MKLQRNSDLFDRLAEVWATMFEKRRQMPGAGNHTHGHSRPHGYRRALNRQRKAQRRARLQARRQVAGRKHRRM